MHDKSLAFLSIETNTSAGSNETEVNEFTVIPFFSPLVILPSDEPVTPVAKCPKQFLSSLTSTIFPTPLCLTMYSKYSEILGGS